MSETAVLPDDASCLIVDDDMPFRTRLGRAMEKRGFVPLLAEGAAEAKELIRQKPPTFAVVDLRLEDGDGIDIVNFLHEQRADARAVILTGYGNITTAVAAVKAGAIDYLAKPADADDVFKALLAKEGEL
ncbi:MAG: response regulator, partial [Pseudomonadota bacterium]